MFHPIPHPCPSACSHGNLCSQTPETTCDIATDDFSRNALIGFPNLL